MYEILMYQDVVFDDIVVYMYVLRNLISRLLASYCSHTHPVSFPFSFMRLTLFIQSSDIFPFRDRKADN